MCAKISEKLLLQVGFLENPHGFLGGKSKNHVGPQWGEGGQKLPKSRPHGLWMPPNIGLLELNRTIGDFRGY